MTVINTIIGNFKNKHQAHYLLALSLSTLMLGYAPSSIALGLFVLYVLFKANFKINKVFQFNYKQILPILLFIWFAITFFWSVDKNLSVKGIGRTLPLFVIPFVFCIYPKLKKNDLIKVLDIFTWSNVIFGLFFIFSSLLRYKNSTDIGEFTYHNLVSDLDLNAIYVSAFFSISIFHLITKKKIKKHETSFAGFLFFLLVLLASKTILFCVVFGLILYSFKILQTKPSILPKAFLIAIVGIIIGILASKQISDRVKEEINIISKEKVNLKQVFQRDNFSIVYPWTGTSIRLFQIRLLKEQIAEKDIFFKGFGLFASRRDLKERHEKYNTYKKYHHYNYHNTYAQILSETGFIGLLIFLATIGVNLVSAIKSNNFLFIFFSILIPIWCITESILWVQRGVYFFTLFYSLFNSLDYRVQ